MGIETDLATRMDALAQYRTQWEVVWRDCARYGLPNTTRFNPGSSKLNPSSYDAFAQQPTSVTRGRERYDDTAMRAVDRVCSGLESLITPQSEKWHGLANTDPLSPPPTDEERAYWELFRDYMFAVRYHPRAGFIGAHQKALRSSAALGTGIVFVEENMGAEAYSLPVLYRYLPLSECYLAVNAQGEPDTLFRKFSMSARQMVQQFGDKVHQSVQNAADNPSEKDRQFQVIHAVQPRKEAGSSFASNRNSAFASFYLDMDNQTLLGESGFYEFPFVVYYWEAVEENIPYAQSLLMSVLSDVKALNATRKTSLSSLEQYLAPPLAVANDGVMNRPNLNPRAINMGGIDANGRMRIQPILTNQRPDFIQEILNTERTNINDSMYVTLFQILLQNPNMTATEAMIRANEKGELLGPVGSRIQIAMAKEVDRVSAIMIRKGATKPGAALEPPDSLGGRNFGASFTSPLDRLRRAPEALGVQRTFETLGMLGDPSVVDNFDTDKSARVVSEINGMPAELIRPTDQRDAMRQQRQQMQQAQAALEMAKMGGDAAKNLVPAAGAAAQMMGNGQGAPA